MNPLERLRIDRGLSRSELGRLADVSPKTIGAIEAGTVRDPAAPTVARLAAVLREAPADTGPGASITPADLMAALRAHNADTGKAAA